MTLAETLIGFGFFFAVTVALVFYFKARHMELIIPFTLIAASLTILAGLLEWWVLALILLVDIILVYLSWRGTI